MWTNHFLNLWQQNIKPKNTALFLLFFLVSWLLGCNRCLFPIEGLKATHRKAQTHTLTNQTFSFHLGTLYNQSLPKPSNLRELWPGLHQASANSELAYHRHKDKWPYQCKVPNDWQVCGVWGGLCGQTHVVALDKPLFWNERAHLWVLCASGTSPPAERGNRLVCSSYERS